MLTTGSQGWSTLQEEGASCLLTSRTWSFTAWFTKRRSYEVSNNVSEMNNESHLVRTIYTV